MNPTARTLDHEGLTLSFSITKDTATLVWSGVSEMRSPEAVLEPFLKARVMECQNLKLVVDFRPFEFMTSATQAPIVQFLKNLHKNKISTVVMYNTQLEWQRVSYRCMKILFRAMPSIQFECL